MSMQYGYNEPRTIRHGLRDYKLKKKRIKKEEPPRIVVFIHKDDLKELNKYCKANRIARSPACRMFITRELVKEGYCKNIEPEFDDDDDYPE